MNAATASLLVPLLLLPVCPLAAQQPIVTGDRVRIVAPDFATTAPVGVIIGPNQRRLEGVVVGRDSAALSIQVPGQSDPVVVPIASIQSLDVHRGHDASAGNSAATGFLVGASLGAVIGVADGSDPPGSIFGFSAGTKAAILGIAFGGAGAALGALVGVSNNTGTWEQVPLTDGRLSARPIIGSFDGHGKVGIGLGVNLTF
ncbi:MAG TPA: hypothetical protein VI160_03405 [Gemmatimonadales bacterium]